VIYVHEFLAVWPDAFDLVSVAGPNQDTTSPGGVRPADQLRAANEWGNLVNRSVSHGAQEHRLGGQPGHGDRGGPGPARPARGAFDVVGLSAPVPFKMAATEAMRVVSAANKYISEQEPWKLATTRPAGHRAAHRVCSGAGRQHAAHPVPAALGAEGAQFWAQGSRAAELQEVEDLDVAGRSTRS